MTTAVHFVKNDVTGQYMPALYPGEKSDDWNIPEDIKSVFNQLNSIIETKYTREYLKICAFYNKLFPSLKISTWTRTSYNVPPFTSLDQERTDTGTGICANYLKQTIDQVVARIGTIDFEAALLADYPTLEYIIYKDEVERLTRKMLRDEDLTAKNIEVFHNASVVGFSHMLIDPFRKCYMKVNDYEAGFFEGQFNRGKIRQFLFRDYSFPVTELVPYIAGMSKSMQDKVIRDHGSKQTVDFKMYFDCPSHKVWIVIGGDTLEPTDYPFDEVLVETFNWDTGFSKVTSASLFDSLYPIQREMNKIMAKEQQMIRLYKGAVPVFPADIDLAMKEISNGSGEALYVNSTVPVDKLVTVIQPTPLDPALMGKVNEYKQMMQEIAGIQSMSFDMENMRSAASVVALDQAVNDNVFKAQMIGMASFVKRELKTWVKYCAGMGFENYTVSWSEIKALLDGAYIDLKPVHLNDPLGNRSNGEDAVPPDYEAILINKCVIAILKGTMTYDDCTYLIDKMKLAPLLAYTMIRLQAVGISIPESAEQFMISCFVTGIQTGLIDLGAPVEQKSAPQVVQEAIDSDTGGGDGGGGESGGEGGADAEGGGMDSAGGDASAPAGDDSGGDMGAAEEPAGEEGAVA